MHERIKIAELTNQADMYTLCGDVLVGLCAILQPLSRDLSNCYLEVLGLVCQALMDKSHKYSVCFL